MTLLPAVWFSRVEHASQAELPSIIGELEQAKAKAWARLHQPVITPAPEPLADARMIGLDEAAKRLGMSRSWLYRNAATLLFATRPNGHNWRLRKSTPRIKRNKRINRRKVWP